MPIDSNSRREFLHRAGAGMAATRLGSPGKTGARQGVGAAPRPWDFNVRSFGAVGDGKALDTDGVNKAIQAAAASGATAYFSAGTYLCHSTSFAPSARKVRKAFLAREGSATGNRIRRLARGSCRRRRGHHGFGECSALLAGQ
jgi:Pectate lyase superfamily protein